MSDTKSQGRLPPYVSYRTFRNFVEGLRQRVPARIDRSYWGDTMSGSTGTQLTAALRFLGLIDATGSPTSRLRPLAIASGEQKATLINEILTASYDFIQQSSLDLQSATYAQLKEAFNDRFQLTDDVRRKCIKFFIEMANDAGIVLSPFITKRFRSERGTSGTKVVVKRQSARTNRNNVIPNNSGEIPHNNSWGQMLLTKFPAFDPEWNDEVKLKWFSAFDELLKRNA